jgi:hypothetical protein
VPLRLQMYRLPDNRQLLRARPRSRSGTKSFQSRRSGPIRVRTRGRRPRRAASPSQASRFGSWKHSDCCCWQLV